MCSWCSREVSHGALIMEITAGRERAAGGAETAFWTCCFKRHTANGRIHVYKCVVSRSAYRCNVYNNKKKINYPKLVKQIYFVIDNFHVTTVSHSFTPSPPSDISVFSLINWSQEGPYGSVWWKKTKMKQASQA